MKLTRQGIENRAAWEAIHVDLPQYDIGQINENTRKNPAWVHFGTGNIFRGFLAPIQQKLLNQGLAEQGIVAVKASDFKIIDQVYTPYDNLSLLVLMGHDGQMKKEVIASISEIIRADCGDLAAWTHLRDVFVNPSLQMVSLTITEKGYALKQLDGSLLPSVLRDIEGGPRSVGHTMSILTAMLYERFKAGSFPIALVSMDNCSKNGEKLFESVSLIAEKWAEKGFVEKSFLDYLRNENAVAFPWTMIDKITPNPAGEVQRILEELGVEDMNILETNGGSRIAPFVNAEVTEYLIVEENFPNGRPPLEKAGVIFTDRLTVERTEKMKVGTCLNPLHTALAIFGCLLGFQSIAEEMKDPDLVELIRRIAFDEAMAVVVDPGIIRPQDFVKEVIEVRFPNPFIPDTPQRIATDTSQKVPVRYGKTLEAYLERKDLSIQSLKYIPLVFAAWCRYLMEVDDQGREMKVSSDPLLDRLQQHLQGVSLGDAEFDCEKLRPILSSSSIFGVDLYEVGLAEKTADMFRNMIREKGGVRSTLRKILK